MEVQSDYVESAPSALAFQNFSFCKTEDSGYHTSFTPGSLEYSELSSELLDQSLTTRTPYFEQIKLECRITSEVNIRPSRRNGQLKRNENSGDTPPLRRGIKRPHPGAEPLTQKNSIPTPTTFIAGKIQSLEVNDGNKENPSTLNKPRRIQSAKRYLCEINTLEQALQYPVTPVKRNCKSSPCGKSVRKLDFAIHALACERTELQPVSKHSSKSITAVVKPILTRPDQKIDILHLLHHSQTTPPLKKIFSYLTIQDIRNFCLVSSKWEQVWMDNSTKEEKYELRKFLKGAKENQENNNSITPKATCIPHNGCLMEIHNEIYDKPVNRIHSSPPRSPKTIRFIKYVKTGSLDMRIQLPCVRCSQPAKLTQETNGEKWAECTSSSCAFQFCRSCNSDRHPGRSCEQYGLNAPSPSKRKKCENVIGTKKSRQNLKRLIN